MTHKKLSRLQKEILRRLLANAERERRHPRPGELKNCFPLKDIFQPGRTPAEAAAVSRSLLRLERRGLVVRTEFANPGRGRGGGIRGRADDPPPARTTHLILTPAGEEVAKRLT